MRLAPTLVALVALNVVACGSDQGDELPRRTTAGPVQGAGVKPDGGTSPRPTSVEAVGNGNATGIKPGQSSVVDPYRPGTNGAPPSTNAASNAATIPPATPSAGGGGDNSVLVPLGAQPGTPPAKGLWKGLLMTGDYSIDAFDNARKKLTELFDAKGAKSENLKQLSMKDDAVDKTSRDTIKAALQGLSLGTDDRCLVHMTSHGSREGFYLADQDTLAPEELDQMLSSACGTRPTVVLVSACYSGVFTDSPAMQKPNRIILTAARADRTSFGCGTENQYTYWDGCLVENFAQATSWKGLYDSVKSCITEKEAGGFTPSEPQAFFGASVSDLGIFD